MKILLIFVTVVSEIKGNTTAFDTFAKWAMSTIRTNSGKQVLKPSSRDNTPPVSPSTKQIKMTTEIQGYQNILSALYVQKAKMLESGESAEKIMHIETRIEIYESQTSKLEKKLFEE